jgi:hypothetical protein
LYPGAIQYSRARVRVLVLTLVLAALALGSPATAAAVEETLVLRSRAITLKPYEVVQGAVAVPSPKLDGYVTRMSAELVDMLGRVQTRYDVMLHHAVFLKALAPDTTCSQILDYDGRPSPLPAERFYATGEELAELSLPEGYGYPNRGSDIWALVYMLMNHRNRAATVQVQYRVQYVTGESLRRVVPVWLDVRNCRADPIFDVPGLGGPGSTYARTWQYRLPFAGRIVAAGGHLHGGGRSLELENASCRTKLFRSLPTWAGANPKPVMHEPGPSHMSGFSVAPGVPVAAGETLRLRAVYENSRPHTRVMGILQAYVALEPVARCQRPPALPGDPASRPGPPPKVVLPLLTPPRGPVARDVGGTWVGDFRFGHQRVELDRGRTFRWRFVGASRHDVTLATGPVGFSSPSTSRGTFTYRFTRRGTYALFCSLHPTRMTQRVRVR